MMAGGRAIWVGAVVALLAGGCPVPGDRAGSLVFNNTVDPTNGGARYLTSAACRACHPGVAAAHELHGHAHALKPVFGGPPAYPPQAAGAGVPEPPAGFDWTDVAYVIGGYRKGAWFVDRDGFVLTSGLTGVDTQWNLSLAANGTPAGFVPFEPQRREPLPLEFSRFGLRVTGAALPDAAGERFQENRPGIAWTWVEAGVQCEACHGPGSNHVPNPAARTMFVDSGGTQSCRLCHDQPLRQMDGVISAAAGYILPHEQWSELAASGAHARFACTVCHDPHRSVTYDRTAAIRNDCRACHAQMTMAGHGGRVLVRGDYREPLTCESCHMPFATRSFSAGGVGVVGPLGRMGDTRTHIFRIRTDPVDYRALFTDDGRAVRLDERGRAAVTVDFVCLRCHNDIGAFALTVNRAAEIAQNVHELP